MSRTWTLAGLSSRGRGHRGTRGQPKLEIGLAGRLRGPSPAEGRDLGDGPGGGCVRAFSTEFKKGFPQTTGSPRGWAAFALGGFFLWYLCCIYWLPQVRGPPPTAAACLPEPAGLWDVPFGRHRPHDRVARRAHMHLARAVSVSASSSLLPPPPLSLCILDVSIM